MTRTRKTPVSTTESTPVSTLEDALPEAGVTEYRELTLTELIVNPDNGRKKLPAIEELADSIREVGILEPLVVRPHAPGLYQVCFGHRRFAAAQRAELVSVPCRIMNLGDAELIQGALIENFHREGLTYLEEAEKLSKLMDMRSLDVQDLARSLGKSPLYVSQRLSLLTLTDKARAAIDAEAITLRTALGMAELADFPELMDELIDDDGRVDQDELEAARAHAVIERESERLREEATARGHRLFEDVSFRNLGYVYVAELDNLTARQQTAHGRQSCHAVYLEVALGRPRLTALCSNSGRHRPAPEPAAAGSDAAVRRAGDGATDPAADPSDLGINDAVDELRSEGEADRLAAAEARRAANQERMNRETEEKNSRKRVANARRAFLCTLADKRTPKRAEAAVYVLGAVLDRASNNTLAWVGKTLDIEPGKGLYDSVNWRTPIAAYAMKSSDCLLKVALLVAFHWTEERIPQYASGYDAAAVRYIETLAAMGYVPDPYETEHIAYYREDLERAKQEEADDVQAEGVQAGDDQDGGEMGGDQAAEETAAAEAGENGHEDDGEVPGDGDSPTEADQVDGRAGDAEAHRSSDDS